MAYFGTFRKIMQFFCTSASGREPTIAAHKIGVRLLERLRWYRHTLPCISHEHIVGLDLGSLSNQIPATYLAALRVSRSVYLFR